ncbi:hypothetical protein LDL59_13535 [Kaistella anthropi]|nr:hypothetical protein [Kaistella anthropi]
MVTPYQKERCIAYIREKRPEISYAKVCRVMGRSRTSKYYKKRMPEKDEKLREAITSILGTSRLGRKKVIVKVRKSTRGTVLRKSEGSIRSMVFRFTKE